MSPRAILLTLLLVSFTVGNVLWTHTQLADQVTVSEEGPQANPLLPAPTGSTLEAQEKKLLEDRVNYLETQVKALQQENSSLVDKLAAVGLKEKLGSADKAMPAATVVDGQDNVSLGIELLAFRKLDDVPVPTVTAPQAKVEALILADLQKNWGTDFGTREGAALAAFGLIPEAVDTLPLRAGLLTRQLTGWYDSQSETLHVVDAKAAKEGELIPADAVLAVTHGALLHRFHSAWSSAGKLSTDERLARLALFQGDAALSRFLYRLQHPAPPSPLDDFPADDPDHPLNQVIAPAYLRDMMLFPMSEGFRFAQAMHSIGSWDQMNAAYTRLPASTAEILSDEAYLADHSLPTARIEWPTTTVQKRVPFWDDVLGQYGIHLMLRRYLEEEKATQVSRAWRADRWLAFSAKDKPSRGDVLWQTQWTSPAAAESFHHALLQWLSAHYTAELAQQPEVKHTHGGRSYAAFLKKESSEVLFVDAQDESFREVAIEQFRGRK